MEHLKEYSRKLSAENEKLRITTEGIIALEMNLLPPKISSKATMKLPESIDEQYLGTDIQIEYIFSAWYVKEVSEIQNFIKSPRRDWKLRSENVKEFCVMVAGGNWYPLTLYNVLHSMDGSIRRASLLRRCMLRER